MLVKICPWTDCLRTDDNAIHALTLRLLPTISITLMLRNETPTVLGLPQEHLRDLDPIT